MIIDINYCTSEIKDQQPRTKKSLSELKNSAEDSKLDVKGMEIGLNKSWFPVYVHVCLLVEDNINIVFMKNHPLLFPSKLFIK